MKATMLMAVMGLALCGAAAQAWERLDDAGIEAALSGRILRLDAWTHQVFHADGRTEYHTERYAEGVWSARDGRYCSIWPPAADWTCYDLAREGDRLRFTNDAGIASIGTLEE